MHIDLSFVTKYFKTKYLQNHTTQRIGRWVATKGGNATEENAYKRDFRDLLRCDSKEQYEERLAVVKEGWKDDFRAYYDKHIQPDVDRMAAWVLRDIGFPMTERSTITSNQCESLNRWVKECQGWNRLPIDTAVLMSRDLQRCMVREMGRAMMGPDGEFGSWRLLPQYRSTYTKSYGETLLRRLAGTPDYESIVSLHKQQRILTRTTGARQGFATTVQQVQENIANRDEAVEEINENSINGEENNEDIIYGEENNENITNGEENNELLDTPTEDTPADVLNDSAELQEIVETFEEHNIETHPLPEHTETETEIVQNIRAMPFDIEYIESKDLYIVTKGSGLPIWVDLKNHFCSLCRKRTLKSP